MKNSPYMKIQKWDNKLKRFCFKSYQCGIKGVIWTYNKKRFNMISENLYKNWRKQNH